MARVVGLTRADPLNVGAYELVGRLGAGAQGVVYLGRSPSGQQVAVKLLQAHLGEDAVARGRFVREMESARKVARFCTAQILTAELAGDQPYLVSEYVEGPTLTEHIVGQGPLSGGALERLAVGTATALAAIHRAGIVHRDFKPHNVIMGSDGPRVIDFGIAKALDVAVTSATMIGTPAFMAPEQATGAPIGPAADMFAWGTTIVFAATGRSPFGGDSLASVLNRVLNEEPELGPLSGDLRALVTSCLSKGPADRPSAQQVLTSLLGRDDSATRVVEIELPRSPTPPAAMPAMPTTPVTQGFGEPARPEGPPRRSRAWKIGLPVIAVLAVAAIVATIAVLNAGSGGAPSVTGGGSGSTSSPQTALTAGAYAGDFTLAVVGTHYEPNVSAQDRTAADAQVRQATDRPVHIDAVTGGLKATQGTDTIMLVPSGSEGYKEADQRETTIKAERVSGGQVTTALVTQKLYTNSGSLLGVATWRATRH